MKVCHVFAGTKGGRWVFDQLEALRDTHGCEVTVVLGGEEGTTVDLFRAAGIRVKSANFAFDGWHILYKLPLRALQLAWWMRRERFDVVQSHVIQSTLLARPAAWLADVPVRLAMITGPFFIQAPSTRWMEKATAWMETGIIPSCRATADLYVEAGIAADLVKPVLYYGPPSARFDPATTVPAGLRRQFGLAEGTPLIGCVAIFYPRLHPSGFVPPDLHGRLVKGHEELIKAMPTILSHRPDARLVLIGTGWGEDDGTRELIELAEAAGVADRLLFTGYRTDIAAIYCDLDISVQASLNDNLGGTVESLLMARPTVATRVGGMMDSVIDGVTGRLVAPDNPADLARGIIAMLDDPAEAARLGEAGRRHMLSGFTLETTAAGLAELYRAERARAPSAWRWWIGVLRLIQGGVLTILVLGRAVLYDYLLLKRLRHAAIRLLWLPRRVAGRAWRALGRRRPSRPKEPA